MALINEYALTPDVFDSTCYSADEVCRIYLQHLKEALLQDGLVRNLRDGDWLRVFDDNHRHWHLRGRELLRKLLSQNRLSNAPPISPTDPTSDSDWCNEAIASNTGLSPLSGIVVTDSIAGNFTGNALVTSIDRLSGAPWWIGRSPSVRIHRDITSYLDNLKLILQCSNSIMFIDPYLDPTLPRYRDFIQLITHMRGRTPTPLIEIHRACYEGSGRSRQFPSNADWEQCFNTAFSGALSGTGLSIEVFIWDDLHDRHIISNLIGIQMGNGFDTSRNPRDITTWNRLGRAQHDDIQREFDPATQRHTLRHRFRVP